jgi:hypothetical protein
MTEMELQILAKIKEVADEILETHKNSVVQNSLKKVGVSSTNTNQYSYVNYADLRIVDVSYNLHLDGEEDYTVLIEECSPTAYEFQEFMVKCLKDKLGFFVNVVTEW